MRPDELAVYNDLLEPKLGIEGYSVTRATGNLHPAAGLAEIDYDLKATGSAATGTAMYRFYKSEADAARYFGASERSNFVSDAKAEWGSEDVHPSLIQTPSLFEDDQDQEDVTHLVWVVDPDAGVERVRLAFQDENLIGVVSFTIPRPGVKPTDDVRQQTVNVALKALVQLDLDQGAVALKHFSGGNGAGASWNGEDEEAAGCQGAILSNNDFDTVPYGWKVSGPHYRFADGKFTVLPRKNDVESYYWAVGEARTFDACVVASFVTGSGNFMAFGVQQGDKGQWLALTLWFNGTAEVQTYDPATRTLKSLVPAEVGAAPGIGDGTAVRLAMKIRGSDATFYINGRKFASVAGAVPQGALSVLLQGGSAAGGSSTWAFDDLLVTDGSTAPGGPNAAALVQEGCTGTILISDNFEGSEAPANWQLDQDLKVVDGHFTIKAKKKGLPKTVTWLDFKGQTDPDPANHDVDFCASTVLESGAGLFGGLLVGDGDGKNEVTFGVGNDGTAEIDSYDVNTGHRTRLVKLRADPAIRAGQGNVNFLRVEVRGNEMIFFVNNRRFDSVTDALPQGKLILGLMASTGKNSPAVWGFDNLTLSKPDLTLNRSNPAASQ